jgi:hypothetical protein
LSVIDCLRAVCSGDAAAPFDAAGIQQEFRAQQPHVFDALERSSALASTSQDAIPACIKQVINLHCAVWAH